MLKEQDLLLDTNMRKVPVTVNRDSIVKRMRRISHGYRGNIDTNRG